VIAIGFHRIGWHGFEAELDALGSTLMVEGRWLKFKIGGIAGVDIVSCAWIISMMYQGYSVLWPEAQILWISSSSAWARSCAVRVIISVGAEVVGHAAGGAGVVKWVMSGVEAVGLETDGMAAGAGVLLIRAEGADIGLGTSGLAEWLLSVGTTSGLLMAVAVTICTMVKRIALSWAVLTKAESLGREAMACGAIGIAAVGVRCVGIVGIMVWVVGARKIHWAASKIALIKCGSDGKWCGYLICRQRSIWDWWMASKAWRYCWDCSCNERKSCSIRYNEIVLYRRWNVPRSCSDRIPLWTWSETRCARS